MKCAGMSSTDREPGKWGSQIIEIPYSQPRCLLEVITVVPGDLPSRNVLFRNGSLAAAGFRQPCRSPTVKPEHADEMPRPPPVRPRGLQAALTSPEVSSIQPQSNPRPLPPARLPANPAHGRHLCRVPRGTVQPRRDLDIGRRRTPYSEVIRLRPFSTGYILSS